MLNYIGAIICGCPLYLATEHTENTEKIAESHKVLDTYQTIFVH